MSQPSTLLTVGEAALRLRVSPRTIRRRIGSGDLPVLRLGAGRCAPIRIDAEQLERWLRRRGQR